ncbi:hypothetical protein EK21DRAFT_72791 [Setomelanomma holmii]|uniref:BTB domain-containing protein n=1 Tax=Setomelanomma holmii TaxID=210430 RepID=A0A9P4H2G4_9PLEO|nr:hypothetical protein EK21DRAFT_72791 [Setomelanomma holmii]
MWHDRIVYYRDFAYSTRRLRMANGSIGDVPAATFAEYVDDPFLDTSESGGASESWVVEEEDHLKDAPPVRPSQLGLAQRASSASRCLAVRPGLAHRLYSHRLHVRAKAKLQRDRLLSGPMIDVYVGEAKRHWSIHRNLLCHHSELLEAELEGDGKESKRKDKLALPEYDPAGFELLVKWLYQGKLDDVSDMVDANQKYDYAVSCHKLYLLCDRLDMPQLKNVAMDQYRKGLNQAELVPDADEIDDIYRTCPSKSPFKQLMTRIAARQIMDPGSERDVETYRQCFENNPDFAVDLVKAIKLGTGGMLFEDPTETGNPCEYHDHEDGPNCHIKGKGKVKQDSKESGSTSRPTIRQISSLHKLRPAEPPSPPASSDDASPASSTPSSPSRRQKHRPSPPSPHKSDDHSWYVAGDGDSKSASQSGRLEGSGKVEEGDTTGEEEKASRAKPDLGRSGDADTPSPRRAPPKLRRHDRQATMGMIHQTPSRRGIWEWARAGTGRLSIIGRIPHPEWRGPLAGTGSDATSNGQLNGDAVQGSQDDFSVPSSTNTTLGLGIMHANIVSPSFSQTKRSSDELVATASSTGTPEPKTFRDEPWTNGNGATPSAVSKDSPPSTPDTPTPPQRKKETPEETQDSFHSAMSELPQSSMSNEHRSDTPVEAVDLPSAVTPKPKTAENKETPTKGPTEPNGTPTAAPSAKKTRQQGKSPSPHRIPKYKVALASNLLTPAKSGIAST